MKIHTTGKQSVLGECREITDLAKIIGNWYMDVANALDGKQHFIMAATDDVAYQPALSAANHIPHRLPHQCPLHD
jgi:hypothetical protein